MMDLGTQKCSLIHKSVILHNIYYIFESHDNIYFTHDGEEMYIMYIFCYVFGS